MRCDQRNVREVGRSRSLLFDMHEKNKKHGEQLARNTRLRQSICESFNRQLSEFSTQFPELETVVEELENNLNQAERKGRNFSLYYSFFQKLMRENGWDSVLGFLEKNETFRKKVNYLNGLSKTMDPH